MMLSDLAQSLASQLPQGSVSSFQIEVGQSDS